MQTQRLVEPDGPDALPTLRLHRGHDGFVTFHTKGTRFRNLPPVPAAELRGYFPQFLQELERDSFFSINGFGSGRRGPKRSSKLVRWLNAAFADLDCYRAGISEGQALGALHDYQQQGWVPPVSLVVFSGRGIWAFWLIRNKDDRYPLDGPARAWPENVLVWQRIQNELCERLAHLESDAGAIDVARITRVAGSINGRARGKRVRYYIPAGADGLGFTYTLDELASLLGVRVERPRAVRHALSQAEKEAKRRGYAGRWVKAIVQFERLREMRGGFRTGHRYYACRLYAALLTNCSTLDTTEPVPRLNEPQIAEAVHRLASECRDEDGRPCPLEPKDVDDALAAREHLAKVRNQTISNMLQVTPEEADALETWPFASKYRSQPTAVQTASHNQKAVGLRAARRAFLRDYAERAGVPTLREAIALLDKEGPPTASPATIRRDYAALGIKNPRGRADAPALPLDAATI